MGATADSSARTTEDDDLVSALSQHIRRELAAQDVPGVTIALGRSGKLVWSAAFGFADLATRRPMDVDSVFKSGSMGKTYTGTAIMQLVEQGLLALDQPINELLPFTVKNPFGGDVKVRHLMTHSAGLGTTLVDSCTSPQTHRPLGDVLAEFVQRDHDVLFGGETNPIWIAPAGQHWCYSNLGIGLLGLIVECNNAERLDFSSYVQRRIMDPLGMKFAAFPPIQAEHALKREIWERMMTGHTVHGGVTYTAAPNYFQVAPAGGFVSTAGDHLRLIMAMLNDGELDGSRILSEASVAEMLTPTGYIVDGHARQGLIWRVEARDDRVHCFHHGGGHMYGFRTHAAGWPAERVGVVAAANAWPLSGQSHIALPLRAADFVDAWMTLDSSTRHSSKPWPWKVSYLRGARFIELNNHALAPPDPLGLADVCAAAESISQAEFVENWDAAAFMEGASDMLEVPLSAAAITEFVRSARFKLTAVETARILWFLEGPADQRPPVHRTFLDARTAGPP